jgi:hypothetical protein
MNAGKRWLLLCSALMAACVANDRSTRPPLVAPPPSQAVISVAGFDDAMRVGSDYIYATKLPDRVFIGSQELPGNLWLLRFGTGATGTAPVDLMVDTKEGKVVRELPAGAAAELKATPGADQPSDAPSVPTPVEPPSKPAPPPLMPRDVPAVPE